MILRQFAKYQTKKILAKGQLIADTDHTFIMSLTGGGFNLGKQNIYTVFNKYSIYVQYLINNVYFFFFFSCGVNILCGIALFACSAMGELAGEKPKF